MQHRHDWRTVVCFGAEVQEQGVELVHTLRCARCTCSVRRVLHCAEGAALCVKHSCSECCVGGTTHLRG